LLVVIVSPSFDFFWISFRLDLDLAGLCVLD